jgi:hypothetical protein
MSSLVAIMAAFEEENRTEVLITRGFRRKGRALCVTVWLAEKPSLEVRLAMEKLLAAVADLRAASRLNGS